MASRLSYATLCRSRLYIVFVFDEADIRENYTTPKCHPVNLLKHTGTASLLSDRKMRREREREREKSLADRLSQTETIIYNLVASPEHARTKAKHFEQNALCRCGLSGSKVLKVCCGLFRMISPVISGNRLLLHGACQFTTAKTVSPDNAGNC